MDIGHVLEVAMRTAREPLVLRMTGWATLAAVIVDVGLTFLVGRRVTSLLAALSSRGRGGVGAVLVGLVHPLLILLASAGLALAAARVNAVMTYWWASGLAIGLGFAAFAWVLERAPAARLAGPVLTGVVLACAARIVSSLG